MSLNKASVRELLNRASGGVVFTTIHKFMPEKCEVMLELSARQNIVVISDEAHRSQFGFGGKGVPSASVRDGLRGLGQAEGR